MARRPDPEYAPDRLTAYEIPLRTGDALRTPHDIAAILRTVHTGTHIYPRDKLPEARLCGFLFLAPDRLRLYLDTEEAPSGMTAADVRPGGAPTALLAALPSLLDEQRLTTTDADDPHCARVVDLTDW
ncbi:MULTISPECIES: hypothetical protein [Streptomyces]|uniref:Uncharacterized protein n=2 Tax=Streptomyces rimosus subsp. rimosus TaxID=132474 RepID=L8ETD0_STRR1|nr:MULTISPECIES: hypothetical protein [Streptomyces]KOG78234.1 hypothetical protein ADK78_07525 [Kitasatospora aureofaciens]MYT46787.1 hypothetical protein [Streptomyces sp. SID5471]KOT41566.1 hypothetical protein ADK42_11500 [Streptomyces rimosus subsp. rimosus]KOT46049.1 hypothetical protein ADK84_03235 [Streptomyces sp. NRRL WC-3701]KOT61952.1 hypothetical protein ADK44_13365 [Streptomyces rimosus subsp. rimosus]